MLTEGEYDMSVKKSMDKTMAALDNGKTRVVRLYDFVNGLSVKNKANFDIQLKSDKFFAPLFRHSIGYNKEIRVMPIVYGAAGIMALITAMKVAMSRK